jgi:hypothetical protein
MHFAVHVIELLMHIQHFVFNDFVFPFKQIGSRQPMPKLNSATGASTRTTTLKQ